MKKLLTILGILICYFSEAQITYTPMTAAGYRFKYLAADSGLAVPFRNLSTGRGVVRPGSIICNTVDSIFYGFNGIEWLPLGEGEGTTTAGKVDSVTISGNNLFYWIGSAGTGTQINKIDSVKQKAGTDSIFTYIGGVATFVYRNIAAAGAVSNVTSSNNFLSVATGTTTPVLTIDTVKLHSFAYLQTQFAARIHVHSAADITTGTLTTARGGTGLSGIGSVAQQIRVTSDGLALEYFTPVPGQDAVDSLWVFTIDTLAWSKNGFTYYIPYEIINPISTYAGLRAMTTTPWDNVVYKTTDDGVDFIWDAVSTATDDGYTVLKVDALTTGRFIKTDQELLPIGSDDVISGGIVTWTGTGLIFDVSPAIYWFNDTRYETPASTVTLAAADPTLPRIDGFVVDTIPAADKITGTAATNPLTPQEDPASQIIRAQILLNPGDLTPSNILVNKIYDEDIEWTTSTTGTITADFNNTTHPFVGSKEIYVSAYNNNSKLLFTYGSTETVDAGAVLKLHIWTEGIFQNRLRFQFFNTATNSGRSITFNSGYGFNPLLTGAYQAVTIPLSAFLFSSGTYNRLVITMVGNGPTSGLYFDNIHIQSGITNIPPQTDYSNKVDSVTRKAGTDSLFYWVKGVSKFFSIVGAGGATYTADNGITEAANNFKLGGTALGANTSIPTSAFSLTVNSSNATQTFKSINSSSGQGLYGTSASGIGVEGLGTSGFGLVGSSVSGTGAQIVSESGLPLEVVYQGSQTSTIVNVADFLALSTGTAANGFGGRIDFPAQTSTGASPIANQIIWKWTDATHATRTSQLDITGVSNAVTQTFANFQTGGIVRVNNLADTLATKAYARSAGGGGGGDLNSSDTAAMLSPYLRSNIAAVTYQPIGDNPPLIPTQVAAAQINNGLYNAFGFTGYLSDGTVFIIYREGTSHVGDVGVLKMRTSTDGGFKWSSAVTIASSSLDLRNAGGGVTKTGRIVCFYNTYNTVSTVSTQGYIYSDDKGATWSTFTVLPEGANAGSQPYGAMIETAGDTLLMSWAGINGTTWTQYVIKSSDNGATWGTAIPVIGSSSPQYIEGTFVYLGGSYILGIIREYLGTAYRQVLSADNGNSWASHGNVTFETHATNADRQVWLSRYQGANGKLVIVCYYPSYADQKMRAVYGYASDLISGVTGWNASSIVDIGTFAAGTALSYASIIHPYDNQAGVGFYSDHLTASNAVINFVTTLGSTVIGNPPGALSPPGALTDGATITWNLALTTNASVTLAGNRTLAFTNAVAGMYGTLVVTQDGTGSRTLALPAAAKVINGGAGAITLTTTAGAKDILSFYFDGTNYYFNYGKNYN